MSAYAYELIQSERSRAIEAIGVAMLAVTRLAQEQNAPGSSRLFIEYQTAIIGGIDSYGRLLRERFAQFEARHSPVSVSDYATAIASVDDVTAEALKLYEQKRENQKPFGTSGLPFDAARLEAVVANAKNELRGQEAEFRSRRSWVRQATDRFISAIGEQSALAVWTIIVLVAGMLLRDPFDAALRYLKGLAE